MRARLIPSGGQENYVEEVTLDFLFDLSFFRKVLAGGRCPSSMLQTPLFLAGEGKARPDPPPERPSLAFHRGGQTGPTRSNDFFAGAADDMGGTDDGLTTVRRPKTAENETLADPNISFCRR